MIAVLEMRLYRRLLYYYSSNSAHIARREVILKNGYKIVDSKTKKAIKAYLKANYGSSLFWPHLALYAEIRGEFNMVGYPKIIICLI